jgi:micrococcal nuclease
VELVRDGWAWWYRKYAPKNKELAAAEAAAQKAKRGLWADPNPIPPWEWPRAPGRVGNACGGCGAKC